MAVVETNSVPSGIVNLVETDDVLEADTDKSDHGSNESLDTMSLTASIFDYEYENGRRYHAYKAGWYILPNDEHELDRLDLQHHVITLLLNGEMSLAPLRNPKQILDIGTGTGLWAIEMADRFHGATITGVDLSPVQPQWVPDNVRFEIDDVESEWLWPENHFDHVHSRMMLGGIADWQEMIKRAFKHCKPGGYIEIQELDPRLGSDDGGVERSPYHYELSKYIINGSQQFGKPIPLPHEYKPWMEAAGFVDVKEYLFKIPVNGWPKDSRLKEVGKYQCLNYTEGYEGITVALFTRVFGWTHMEFSVFMAKVRNEVVDRSIHVYNVFAVVVGRKPYPHEIIAKRYASTMMEADTDHDMNGDPYATSTREEVNRSADDRTRMPPPPRPNNVSQAGNGSTVQNSGGLQGRGEADEVDHIFLPRPRQRNEY